MKRIFIFGLLIIALAAASPAGAAAMKVFVSILPQKYFVEKIGGDLVDVSVTVLPGADPHTYEPKPRQMVDLSQTKIYFAVGVGFEEVWLKKITAANKKMVILHTEKGIKKIPMTAHHHPDESGEQSHNDADHQQTKHEEHADHEEHHHGRLDPHVWTSPVQVKIMAKNIRDGLVGVDPAHKAEYMAGYDRFIAELDALDAQLREVFKDRKGMKFMVFHPAWGYLARDYEIEQVPIEIEGKNPKPAQLEKLIEQARSDGIRIIFVQPQISTRSADILAKAIGGQVVFADPLAEDWGKNLREQAEKFESALK